MVEMARLLWPAAQALIELSERATKRTLQETLHYIEVDYPEGSQILLTYIESINSYLLMPDLPKGPNAKARRLICEVVAKKFGISASYAERWVGPSLTSMTPTD
jgi:hypothetical protein